MATFNEIKEIRLILDDPSGFIDIQEVATQLLLPATTAAQTVYKVLADGKYMSTDIESGATSADYERNELLFSDTTIGDIFDNFPNSYLSKLIRLALPKLLTRLNLLRNKTGTETVDYISLSEKYKAYKDMLKEFEKEEASATGTNTGQYLKTTNPTIAGGDI